MHADKANQHYYSQMITCMNARLPVSSMRCCARINIITMQLLSVKRMVATISNASDAENLREKCAWKKNATEASKLRTNRRQNGEEEQQKNEMYWTLVCRFTSITQTPVSNHFPQPAWFRCGTNIGLLWITCCIFVCCPFFRIQWIFWRKHFDDLFSVWRRIFGCNGWCSLWSW